MMFEKGLNERGSASGKRELLRRRETKGSHMKEKKCPPGFLSESANVSKEGDEKVQQGKEEELH